MSISQFSVRLHYTDAPGGNPCDVCNPFTVVMGGMSPEVVTAAPAAPLALLLLRLAAPAAALGAAAPVVLCELEMKCCPARPTRIVRVPMDVCEKSMGGGGTW